MNKLRQVGFGLLILLASLGPAAAETERIKLPLPPRYGLETLALPLAIYRPPGNGPFPLILYSHGRAANREARAKVIGLAPQHADYWLNKGFAVIAPIRPGYGESAAIDPEYTETRWRLPEGCVNTPDYQTAVDNAVWASRFALDWARQQPWVKTGRILLEGSSVGGVVSLALGAENPPGVAGVINFAGGMGGFPEKFPGQSCAPERLADLYRSIGARLKRPSLWLYAANDSYWGPEVPKTWFAAFGAGGGKGWLVSTPPVPGRDGHLLMYFGGSFWAQPMDAFLSRALP